LLVDTHCHLYFDVFDDDRLDVVTRAREFCVARILNAGIDLQTSRKAIRLAEEIPEFYAAVGVHPNDSNSWTEDALEELYFLTKQSKVVAIGEIGLDYYRNNASHDFQKKVFQQQLSLAKDCGLPVVIHIRNASFDDQHASEEALQLLITWQKELEISNPDLAKRPGVLHSFSSRLSCAQLAIKSNFMIGITGPITFKNAEMLRAVVSKLPLESVLIETDAPFLAPHPYRGRRNEPAYVKYVAEKIAQIREEDVEIVAQTTTINAEKLFLW
jgi:TatD DNase family protein